MLALIIFCDLARAPLKLLRPWRRWLLVAAVFGMLKEAFRANLMNGVVTTAWTFSAALALSPILYSLTLAGLVVLVAPRLKSTWLRLVAALVITAAMTFAVKPVSALLLTPLMASIASFNHADVYPFPYGGHTLIWAYITYFEPVIACIIAAVLVWPRLARGPVLRTIQFVTLILLIKGALVPTFVFSLYNAAGVAQGM